MSSFALLTVTIEPLDEACLVRARGELDLDTADRLRSALEAARADGVTTLLDLSAVSFIDAAGRRGRAWINGREIGGPKARIAHLSLSHD